MKTRTVLGSFGQWFQDSLPTWYDPCYRPPLPRELCVEVDPRRADSVAWYLRRAQKLAPEELRAPSRISYRDLARVHESALLEELGEPRALAHRLEYEGEELGAQEYMHTLRVVCGGTLEGARQALRSRGPCLNLAGGWVQVGPEGGEGMAQVNDVAVCLAALRAEGLRGPLVVLSVGGARLNGLRACQETGELWLGELPATGAGLQQLEAALREMPRAALSVVVCGSLGLKAGLSLTQLRARDLRIEGALDGRPRLYLPGPGGGAQAWRALAGTALAVGLHSERPVDPDFNPMRAHFAKIAKGLSEQQLAADSLSWGVAQELGQARGGGRLLGFYTAEGMEHGLYEYGVLDHLRRLGYRRFEVEIDSVPLGDRLQLTGRWQGERLPLVQLTVSSENVDGQPFLYVHWLSLRNPKAEFSCRRPRLPGQDAPGLGMAPEFGELLRRMAKRLGMAGVAMQPSWLHVAYAARYELSFQDPGRQGRFEALIRDLRAVPLAQATRLLSTGKVLLNGEVYVWEADRMTSAARPDAQAVAEHAASSHFEVVEQEELPSPQ